MAAEEDAEEVVGLALLEFGGGEELNAGVDLWQRGSGGAALTGRRIPQQRLDSEPLHAVAAEQFVVDAEAGLRGQVVGGVEAGEEAVLLSRRVAQPAEHSEDLLGIDEQGRLLVVEAGA